MDTNHLDLNLLAILETLLAERNVTKAAARLHLSQPAVSAQLSRLRDIFDDPLLLPTRRGMIPTERALQLAGPLRDALDQLRNAVQSHQDFDPASAELTVSIACSDYIQAAVIAPLAQASRQRAPGVRIAVRHLAPALMEPQLASGEADLAIATPDATPSHLRSRHLFDETYVLIGRRSHPRLVEGLTIDDYVALEHVVVSRHGGHFRTPIDDSLEALGRKSKVVLSAGSFLFVPEIVSESDLVALVPRRLLQRREERLTMIELPWLGERFEVGMIWHERSHGHAGHRWLRELIVEIAGDRTGT